MVKISVIMPAYNAEQYIAQAIESILNQTFTDFEFIIINDGSSDKTAEIIKSYKDKRINFIDNKKNQGLIAVLNQGLAISNGEYIARMDSDDISLPERFEKQVKYLDAHPEIGVLGTSIIQFGEHTKEQEVIKKPKITYLDIVLCCPVVHPSAMIRKSILDKYNLRYNPDYQHAEDYYLWSQAIKYTNITNLKDVLLKYRYHDKNVSIVYNTTQNKIAQKISDEMIDFLTDIPELKNEIKKLAKKTRFYNTSFLSIHMLKRHPIRWFKLRKALKKGNS